MTETSAPAEVVQADDRLAAWPYRPSCYKDDPATRERWMAGTYDLAAPVIQAFARHRPNTRPVASPLDHIGGVFAGEGGMFSAVALDAETVEAIERDIRISIWNGLNKSGVRQDFAQIYIRAIMEEDCMKRALAALSPGKTGSAGVGEGTP